MLKILVNAYAVSPHTGSEPGMGWNWCSHLAKHCELHIITEGEFKEHIEKALKVLPHANNMHFYYNPVSDKVRKMCWDQGDWRFYYYYRLWQKKTYKLALKICKEKEIDMLYQLNMIGFREPGYLWEINKIPFIWGPIGGLKQFPTAYLKNSSLKNQLLTRLKNSINIKQLKSNKRVHKALNRADLLISSIPDSYAAIKKYKGLESVLIPETGCFPSNYSLEEVKNSEGKFNILWIGKFDFRKQLPLALKAIWKAKNKEIKLHVYGKGNKGEELAAKKLLLELGIKEQVIWYGNQPNDIVQIAMRNSQLFLFTSVSEDTSTVIPEAISNNLPVLCFDTCGMGAVIDSEVGHKIKLTTPEESVDKFAEKINYFYNNRSELKILSHNCKQRQLDLSWDEKALKVMGLLEKL